MITPSRRMRMNNIREKFSNLVAGGEYQRVDATHPLNLYLGIDFDGRETIALITEKRPNTILPSKSIDVSILQRNDNKWSLGFHLKEKDKQQIFYLLCDDMVESSRKIQNSLSASNFIANRFLKWQKMFAKTRNGLLTEAEIKGLIGELYFFKNYLLKHYDADSVLAAWIGPEKADQDFVFSSCWYEVKTISSGKSYVTISSVEQLDQTNPGELAVVVADKTSTEDSARVTLNSIFAEMKESFEPLGISEKFATVLLDFGYCYREEYEEYPFSISEIIRFCVNDKFPKIKRAELSAAVINATYNLSLPAVKEFTIK
jgi:hypothetical protein